MREDRLDQLPALRADHGREVGAELGGVVTADTAAGEVFGLTEHRLSLEGGQEEAGVEAAEVGPISSLLSPRYM